MRRVAVLGATGSIGRSTLDVIQRHSDRYEVTLLSAHHSVDDMEALCRTHQPTHAVMGDPDAAAALAVSATRDPQKVVFGPQRGPRDVSAAPGLSPAAFESQTPSRAPSAGSWADLGAPPPGRESSGSWGDLGVLAEPAALSTVVPAAAPADPALLPPAYLDLAGVPAIVSPPNMRRVASEPYEPLLLDADVLRTAGPIHPLVLDDVLPVALVQTTP